MTTESKHTPGPWTIDEHAQIKAGEYILGRLYSGDIFPNEDLPECTANGHLIASAPELLAERDRLKEENEKLKESWLATEYYKTVVNISNVIEYNEKLQSLNKELVEALKDFYMADFGGNAKTIEQAIEYAISSETINSPFEQRIINLIQKTEEI